MEDNKDSMKNPPCSENCCCQKPGTSSDNETPSISETSSSDSAATSTSNPPKDKKGKLTLTSLGLNFRRGKSLQFTSKKNKKTTQPDSPSSSNSSIKKSPKWGLKFSSTKSKESKVALTSDSSNANLSTSCCQCVNYNKEPEEDPVEECEAAQSVSSEECEKVPERQTTVTFVTTSDVACVSSLSSDSDVVDPNGGIYGLSLPGQMIMNGPLLDVAWLSGLHHQDCDEAARLARAREIEQGVEAPPGFRQVSRVQLVCSDGTTEPTGSQPRTLQLVCPPDLTVDSLRVLFQTHHMTLRSCPADNITGCHTQVDFIHCLVPDLYEITNCSFYWGKIDRYEAERLLDGKPEGTFLLRDSAQEEFLFSVSFRKYGRSLHARIEQWNHKFSFDAHDPGVYTSDTVCGLIEHYKDPSGCMFFEPMLTWPLHRNFTFSLQHLCRSVIVKRLTYDNINLLQLPKSLKTYMKEYHYRQKVRVARFDDDVQWLEVRNVPP